MRCVRAREGTFFLIERGAQQRRGEENTLIERVACKSSGARYREQRAAAASLRVWVSLRQHAARVYGAHFCSGEKRRTSLYDSKTPSVQIIRSQLNVGGWGGVLPVLSSRGQILAVPGIIQIPQQQNR